MKSISVIIPNFNGEGLLKENIPYLYRSLVASGIEDYEIIIPDDASSDNSIVFLEENYPEIRIVNNKKNKGFAGNVNTGILQATKDLVFILNSDVQLVGDYFSPSLNHFDKEDTFGVMGRIISMDSDEIQDGAKFPGYSFGKINTTKNYLITGRKSLYTLFMSGANSLLKFGGFNELFNPYYSEDCDLGIAAWRAGYRLYYEHNSVCRHPNSSTINKQSKTKVKTIAKRNRIILHYLHLDGIELIFRLTLYFLKSFFRLFIFDFIYANAMIMFYKNFSKISNYKKNSTALRTKSIQEVCRFIKADFKDAEINIF